MRRSADIALVAGGNQKRWIIATENMQPGDLIKNSSHIGRMAGVSPAPSQPCLQLVGCLAPAHSFALQCWPTKGTPTHWGPCLWAHSSATWRATLGRERSTSGLPVRHIGCCCLLPAFGCNAALQRGGTVLPDDALRLLPQKEVAVALGLCPAAQHGCLLSPAAGTCGVLLRKVNGTAIVQLPSKRHMQVGETRAVPVLTTWVPAGRLTALFHPPGAGDLRGHSGPRVQRRPQQASDRKGRPQPLAGQAPAHGLMAPQGRLGWPQDQATATHEELCQLAPHHDTAVRPGPIKHSARCRCCVTAAFPEWERWVLGRRLL